MNIDFVLIVMMPIICFVLFLGMLMVASDLRKKALYIVALIILIFGIYNFKWVYDTVRLKPISMEIKNEIYEIDKITTTTVYVGEHSYNFRDHIEEIKENTDEYNNILYREITSEVFTNKYLGILDITFERNLYKNSIYVNEDTYKILTHGNIIYEK